MDQPKPQLAAALRAIFRPLASILLREKFDARSVIRVVKAAFVDAASRDYGKKGTQASVSKVSRLTGLSRKDVKRIRDEFAEEKPVHESFGPDEADVLSFWYTQGDYLDKDGYPKTLEFGPGPGSFVQLVQDALRTSRAGDIMDRLLKAECIFVTNEGKVQAVKRELDTSRDMPKMLLESIGSLTNTLEKNSREGGPRHLTQRVVYITSIDPKKVDAARRAMRDRVIRFTEELDDYLVALEAEEPAPFFDREGNELVRIGVGTHCFEIEKSD